MSNSNHDGDSGDLRPGEVVGRTKKGPERDPNDLSEQMIAQTLRRRKSKCSAGCGSDGCGSDGTCGTGGCGVGSIVEAIRNNFAYDDSRHIVEVSYNGYRKGFAVVDTDGLALRVRDLVILESAAGVEWASVSMVGSLVHAKRKAKRLSNEQLPTLVRRAEETDKKKIEQCKISERQAYSVCKTRIESFELPMQLVDAEWQFDHRKLTFYFTADGRVDFRELVRDLAAIFNTRIELRQIPVRDAAKRMGGMGVCGLELCCTTHLGRYEHVTLDHAKIQQIPANPSKLSGQCGRLKCCLLYEIDTYVEGMKRFPPIESKIRTGLGVGIIQKIDLFKEQLYLYHPESSEWEQISLDHYRDIIAGKVTFEPPVEKEQSERVNRKRNVTSSPQENQEQRGATGGSENGGGGERSKGEQKPRRKKKRPAGNRKQGPSSERDPGAKGDAENRVPDGPES